ncbi:hypothetical protein AB0A63_19040 [Lentzea sp. NPDC042327]|uniref:hypothetical protein n=1 Tax=Lentzea sp. NPDC042327 TaxID=3154801 RepID=UPI0033DEED0B
MTDRGRPAALLLVLCGVLVGVGNQLPMYTAMHTSPVDSFAFSGSLWEGSVPLPDGHEISPLLNVGAPVLFTAALTVVAGLLALRRGRGVQPARVVALAAAAAFLGVVVAYGVGVLREEEMNNAFEAATGFAYHFDSGFHLLVLAAAAGLVGAVLAQRPRPRTEPPADDAVVVHQFTDDDTPPFGIAFPTTGEARGD